MVASGTVRCSLLVALLGLGCGGVVSPTTDAATPRRDAGPLRDRGPLDAPSGTADRDGDGLCDATEVMRRTDPARADSDDDGLPDAFEVRIGTDPLNPNSPSSRDRLQLEERDGSAWPLPWVIEWRGMGESLRVTVLDRAGGVDGRFANEVAQWDVAAVNADPAPLVGGAEGDRFFGVRGPVRLRWVLTATWRAVESRDAGVPLALGCRRAYEALAIVKQDGGETVAARRLVLEVSPEGTLDAGTEVAWRGGTTAEGFCRPLGCF